MAQRSGDAGLNWRGAQCSGAVDETTSSRKLAAESGKQEEEPQTIPQLTGGSGAGKEPLFTEPLLPGVVIGSVGPTP